MSVIFLHKTLDTTSYPSIALTVNGTTVAAGYSLTNLQDQYKNTTCKTDTTENQEWRIDLGAAYDIDSFGSVNSNFTTATSDIATRLQSMATAWVTPTTIVNNLATGTAGTYSSFNSVNKRYIRLYFEASIPLAVAPQIGQIFLGTKFTHSYNYTIGNTEETGYAILKQQSWDGTDSAYLQYSAKRKFWGSVRFQILGTTYKTNFDTWFESVKGGYRPFMMSVDSGTTWYYVRVAEDKISYINKSANYFETTLNFYEQIG